MKYILVAVFAIVAVLNVYSQKPSEKGSASYWMKTITKPLIMPLLIGIYISFADHIEILLILAFIFGWLGDIALMLHININSGTLIKSKESNDIASNNIKPVESESTGVIPMMMGMLFFLCGHITYILLFSKDAVKFTSNIAIYTAIYLVYIIYALVMFRYLSTHGFLKPGQTSEKTRRIFEIAISVYMIAITLMSFTSLLRYINIKGTGALICFIGSIVFISSDSVLSIRMLGQNERMSERYIMGSYIIAQTFIMISYLNIL